MTFALVGAGLAIGLLAPWRLTPLVLAPTVYLAFGFDLLGAPSLLAFSDVTTDVMTYAVTRPAAVAWFVSLALTICAVAFGVAWVYFSRSWQAVAATAISTAAFLGAWLVVDSAEFQDSVYRLTSASQWVCRPVGQHGSQVCLPPDQQRDLDLVVGHATTIAQRLDQITPDPMARNYSPDQADWSPTHLPMAMPLGDNSQEAFSWAASFVTDAITSACWDDEGDPRPGLDVPTVFEAQYLLGKWLDPQSAEEPPYFPGRPPPPANPTVDQARQAYLTLEACWP